MIWYFQSKHQKHQAFEAELHANADRIRGVIDMGNSLIERGACAGSEDAVKVWGPRTHTVSRKSGSMLLSTPLQLKYSIRPTVCRIWELSSVIVSTSSLMVSNLSLKGGPFREFPIPSDPPTPSLPKARLAALADQWQFLVQKSAEKSQKLKEANKQQNFNTGIKDFDFWLSEVMWDGSCARIWIMNRSVSQPQIVKGGTSWEHLEQKSSLCEIGSDCNYRLNRSLEQKSDFRRPWLSDLYPRECIEEEMGGS